MTTVSDKGLKPGMWCRCRDYGEWRLVCSAAEHTGHSAPDYNSAKMVLMALESTGKWAIINTVLNGHADRKVTSHEFVARLYEQAEINKEAKGAQEKERGSTTFPFNHDLPDGLWDPRNCNRALTEMPVGVMQRFMDHERRIKTLESKTTGSSITLREASLEIGHLKSRVSSLEKAKNEMDEAIVGLMAKERLSKLDGAAPTPPIGLVPRWIWNEQRLKEIRAAMDRYAKAGVDIPVEWDAEHTMLCMEEAQRMGTTSSPLRIPDPIETITHKPGADLKVVFGTADGCIMLDMNAAPKNLPFEVALAYAKKGRKIKRAGWGDGWYARVEDGYLLMGPDLEAHSLMATDWEVLSDLP